MFKKSLSLLVFVVFVPCTAFCAGFYENFLNINNALVKDKTSYFVRARLDQFGKDGRLQNQSDAVGFFCGENQILRIRQKNSYIYFLSTPNGYWVQNKNSTQPIKISGDFKALSIQVQDILRINYQKDYAIEEQGKDFIILKRVGKKALFHLLKLQKHHLDSQERLWTETKTRFVQYTILLGLCKV